MKSWRRNGGVGETLESEKHWSRRNGGTLESEKWWNIGVGEMEKHWSRRNGGTLESEKWWNIIMTVVAVKVVDYRSHLLNIRS